MTWKNTWTVWIKAPLNKKWNAVLQTQSEKEARTYFGMITGKHNMVKLSFEQEDKETYTPQTT